MQKEPVYLMSPKIDFVFKLIFGDEKNNTVFHLKEDATGYRLTDALEVHFLELPKLGESELIKEEDEAVIDWMMFIEGKSEGVLKMLAEKNSDIKKAYDVLQIISQDEKARMIYEAREAELKDQLTRIKESEDRGRIEGRMEGIIEGKLDVAKKMLSSGIDIQTISDFTEIPVEELQKLVIVQ